MVHITCDIIHIDQDYLKSDLVTLLLDLPELIQQELLKKESANIHIRLKVSEKLLIEKNAHQNGYSSLSDFVRDRCLY